MKISYGWLETYFERSFFGKRLPSPKRLAELLNARAFEVESLDESGNDPVFEIKILPDRAHYALCHRGIAREIGAITGKKLLRRVRRDAPFSPAVPAVSVDVQDSRLCRRYAGRRIENLKIGASPKDISEKLEAVGARAINSIVDIANFVMYDIGQPIHAFDADKVEGDIIVRLASSGEKITLLDGREIELSESDLVIADSVGSVAIAGVKGGKRAEVTAGTKNIIVESANFDPVSVRRTSTRLDLRNDSSKRFENEITPSLAYEALDRVTKMACDACPGAIAGPITDIYPAPVKEWTVECKTKNLREMIGVPVSDEKIVSILESLDFRVSGGGGSIRVTPPPDRLDVMIEEDVADEVSRLYGLERIQAMELPILPILPQDGSFYWSEKIKNVLVGEGFSEVLLYTLVPKGVFRISHPMASDKSALRESLAPKLIHALAGNAHNADLLGLDQVKIFEIGKIFPETGEKTSLCMGVILVKKKKEVTAESVLKKSLIRLEDVLRMKLDATVKNESSGAVVEIDLDALINRLPPPGSLADLDFKILPKDKKYKPYSQYPFIVRDMAFFVSDRTDQSDVKEFVADLSERHAGGLLVKGPDLFDKFTKEGKTSYAFRLIFQSFEKTLSDDEVNSVMENIYKEIKDKGWQAR